MVKYNRIAQVSLVLQKLKIEKRYSKLIDRMSIKKNKLICLLFLQPTEESIKYKVRIEYVLNSAPRAYLVSPDKIATFNGDKPHHLYNHKEDGKERLCVYDPTGGEWNGGMFLADTFIPWIVTWLSAYEIWQITGHWVYPERHDQMPKNEE